ncbi:MAG: leucine-rich repeat domain-containing protein [Bacteroidaceae bacterium]|nr:leucine-rich repeat domain-containing protein [Bacteroidaceae bacterium]
MVSIGSEAFRYCSGLTSVTIPNSVVSIGSGAFSGCDGLTAVHISNLESWCNIVFANGSGNPLGCAKHLYLNGEEITELTIPGNIKSIGDYQFYNCVGMTSIIMHDSIKTIGEGAFSDCDGLTEINLPDSLTIIGEDAFSSCNNLRTISLPKNITSIGKDAFAWNYDIESVYSFAETPVACEENIFTSSTYNDATLYIPHGTEVAYSQTSPWNKFKIKSISTSVENVVPDNQTSDKVCIYTIDGKLFKKGFDFIKEAKGLPSNVYIINGKKVYVK